MNGARLGLGLLVLPAQVAVALFSGPLFLVALIVAVVLTVIRWVLTAVWSVVVQHWPVLLVLVAVWAALGVYAGLARAAESPARAERVRRRRQTRRDQAQGRAVRRSNRRVEIRLWASDWVRR